MNFITIPSLKHISLVQVATTLWKQHDILTLVEEFSKAQLRSKRGHVFYIAVTRNEKVIKWTNIEERVLEKVPQLIIPTSLEEKMFCYIQLVGLEIFKWLNYHPGCFVFGLGLPNKFCWTIRNTVDTKKTAEVYIKDKTIDITARYKMACLYCFEDDILELWYKLPESYKISFYNEVNTVHNFQRKLLLFWWHYIREKANKKNMIKRKSPFFSDKHMFHCAVEGGYVAATEYFWKKVDQL